MAVFEVNFVSQCLNRAVPMHVILPTDKVYFPGMKKREEGKPYKTLYLLHGIVGNYTDWLYGTRIQRWAEERDLAVVMPSGDNFSYLDQDWNGNYYGSFIGEELVRFTRKSFPLSEKKEDTYIGGLSMGGFGAMRNGLKYSDTFGAIISLSPANLDLKAMLKAPEKPMFFAQTLEYARSVLGQELEAAVDSDRNPTWIVKRMVSEKKEFPSIYLACGDQDLLLHGCEDFARLLEEHEIPHLFEIGSGAHEWDFWDTYIKKALDWLPLEDKEAGMNSGNVGI